MPYQPSFPSERRSPFRIHSEATPVSDKAVILIDGGYFDNIDNYAQGEAGGEIDFYRFSSELCKEFDCDLLRTKYYNAYPPQDDDPTDDQKEYYASRQRYYDAINNKRKHQFVEMGRVRDEHADCPECDKHFTYHSQKGTDVGIAVDLLDMAYQGTADAFILVSGDEDMTLAVDRAKEELCNVYVAFATAGYHPYHLYASDKLTTEADGVIRMDPDWLRDCVS